MQHQKYSQEAKHSTGYFILVIIQEFSLDEGVMTDGRVDVNNMKDRNVMLERKHPAKWDICELTANNFHEKLVEAANALQRHVCKDWLCETRFRQVNGNVMRSCSMRFPRPITDVVNGEPVPMFLLSAVDNILKYLPPTDDNYINSYHPLVLLIWLANMDISHISASRKNYYM